MGKKRLSEEDLKQMGLVPNGKGGYHKPKTPMLDKALQQSESKIILKQIPWDKAVKHDEEGYENKEKAFNIEPDTSIIPIDKYSLLGRPNLIEILQIPMIFIPGQVISSKNHRRNFTLKDRNTGLDRTRINKNGKRVKITVSLPTEAVLNYKEATKDAWIQWKDAFKKMCHGHEKPYRIEFFFVRRTKQKFDFGNMCQILTDLMVDYGWIDDDNCDEIVPVPRLVGPVYKVDRDKAGVWIRVL